ncbi:SMC-Scp complex subunit ScpB [Dyella sp. EPa41]|uniref:SMC-Scp complex subunit ScpB n=1 Tax=Dyella sp. EPa41 TaxID=1561194 RepID=UPI001916C7C6|nr:SMC-Scp complex subunit ScpB [Dyella sp. EPa41]
MQIEQLKPIIEAALLASNQPMTVPQLLELFGEEDEVGREEVSRALEQLAEDCAHRGVELREVASGFRYQVKQNVHPWISRMWTEKPSRYSRALLETLALIAYRQPITRPEIEQIRGVVVSSNIIKTMEEREWIRVVGYRDVPGKPALFGTTRAFLDYFNLKSLDELPPLSEIRDMEDPQMSIAPEPLPVRVARDLPIDPDEENETLVVAGEETDTIVEDTTDEAPAPADDEPTGAAVSDAPADEQPEAMEVASSEPGAAPHAEAPTDTADEAATHADADEGDATQDTEEYRA